MIDAYADEPWIERRFRWGSTAPAPDHRGIGKLKRGNAIAGTDSPLLRNFVGRDVNMHCRVVVIVCFPEKCCFPNQEYEKNRENPNRTRDARSNSNRKALVTSTFISSVAGRAESWWQRQIRRTRRGIMEWKNGGNPYLPAFYGSEEFQNGFPPFSTVALKTPFQHIPGFVLQVSS